VRGVFALFYVYFINEGIEIDFVWVYNETSKQKGSISR